MIERTYRTTKRNLLDQLQREDTEECLYSFVLDSLQDTQEDEYVEVSKTESGLQIRRAN